MDERLASLLADLERADSLTGSDLQRAARRAAWLAEFSAAQFAEFLTAIAQLPMPLSPSADRLLANWLIAAVQARRQGTDLGQPSPNDAQLLIGPLEQLYRNLPASSRARGQLLAWL